MGASAFQQMTALQALAGGTAYDNADQAWEAVARAAGNDDAALGSLVGQGKQVLMQAGRVDQGGASYGSTLTQTIKMRDELRRTGTVSDTTRAAVNEAIYDSAADSSSASQAMYGKPGSAGHLAEAHSRKINKLLSRANEVALGVSAGTHTEDQLYTAEREAKQAMASTAGLYDAMAQASPNMAREYANGLTGNGLATANLPTSLRVQMASSDGTTNTVAPGNISLLTAMNNLRAHDTEFAEMRRDYGSQAATADAARAGQVPGLGGMPPTGLSKPPGN
jgi:hypothetical protein